MGTNEMSEEKDSVQAGEFVKEARAYLKSVSLEVVAKRDNPYDVTDLAGCKSRLAEALVFIERQAREREARERDFEAVCRRQDSRIIDAEQMNRHLCEQLAVSKAELERLRGWLKKHLTATCPAAYECSADCKQCPEVEGWLQKIEQDQKGGKK